MIKCNHTGANGHCGIVFNTLNVGLMHTNYRSPPVIPRHVYNIWILPQAIECLASARRRILLHTIRNSIGFDLIYFQSSRLLAYQKSNNYDYYFGTTLIFKHLVIRLIG